MTNRDHLTLTYNDASLRVVFRHGRPWFSAADLCRILDVFVRSGRLRPDLACFKVAPEDKVNSYMPTSQGRQKALLVTERGLYAIAGEADAAKARAFRDWIVDEALPTIRRTYAAARTALAMSPEDIALMREASVLIERLGARVGQGLYLST